MKRLLLLAALLHSFWGISQLDSIHWMPPMHARVDWGPQYFYLSTPETQAFPVTIKDGSGAVIQTVNISNTQPFTYDLTGSNDNLTLVPSEALHIVLKNRGLIVEAKKKFYAYYRCRAANGNHAGDLTCKGRAALGKTFRIGHLLQEYETTNSRRANFIGILATEDSTAVTLSGFAAGTLFRKGINNVPPSGNEKIVLQKGESVVYSHYVDIGSSSPANGLMGTLVEATKPIAINCGSWTGAPVTTSAHDIGIDQIVPIELVGKEYILCKGNGSEVLERPIIIAHFDNTKVWLNGSPTPITTLRAGEYLPVLTSAFTSDGNLHIKSSQPIYVYQMIGGVPSGSNEFRTAGLIFVPPISCAIPNAIDNIIDPNVVGNMTFAGGVMITAMRDSQVTVKINGSVVSIGAPAAVQGNPDFVTYRNLTLFSITDKIKNISIVANGAVQVAMFGQNNAASFAAFYSGFSKTKEPALKLVKIGDGVCPDTLIAKGFYDGVQWMFDDSIVKFGRDSILIAYTPGRYIATGYLGVCRQTETTSDTLNAVFVSPQFPYSLKSPSCFGYNDGVINFGKPQGGLAPYQYSINNGVSFSKNNSHSTIKAGMYRLVVRDSLGCYNSPLTIEVKQPPQLKVQIIAKNYLPDYLEAGQLVQLGGVPNRRIKSAVWHPLSKNTEDCQNCLTYTIYPIEKTNVTLTVTDSAGCVASDSIILWVDPLIYAPNTIAPNLLPPDNQFTLFSKEPLTIKQLNIFDRWGEHLFKSNNTTTNDVQQGWDATTRGKRVAPGVYIFIAEVEILPGRTIIVKGDITVLY